MKKLLLILLSLVCVLVVRGQSVTLDGSGTDPEGGTLTYRWRQLTGPILVTFTPSALVAKPSVTATWQPGVYSFELTVTDNGGLSDTDTMTITVTRPNAAPKSNAGPDKTITLPSTIAVIGLPDAPGLTVEWVKMSGPAAGTIKFPTASITDVTGLVKGQYVFRKIVRGPTGTGSDDVTVTVKSRCFWLFEKLGWCKS